MERRSRLHALQLRNLIKGILDSQSREVAKKFLSTPSYLISIKVNSYQALQPKIRPQLHAQCLIVGTEVFRLRDWGDIAAEGGFQRKAPTWR